MLQRMYRDYRKLAVRLAVLRLYRATDDAAVSVVHLYDRFRSLASPTLVVWGARDPVPAGTLRRTPAGTFPRAKVVVLVEQLVLRF